MFQVQYFLADGQCQLQAGVFPGLVVAHEGPVQDGDRAGEHALQRLVCQRLGVADPFHGHGLGPENIAEQDGRFHAAGAVGLHPAETAEYVAFQLLAEVLHHVVTFRLAVDQHVQPQLFLFLDAVADFRTDSVLVLLRCQLALTKHEPCLADILGLGERADGGCGVARQLQVACLDRRALLVAALALTQLRCDRRDRLANLWVRHAG